MEKDRQMEIDFIMDSLKFTWKQQPNLTFSELIRRVSPAVKSDVGTLYEVRKEKEILHYHNGRYNRHSKKPDSR